MKLCPKCKVEEVTTSSYCNRCDAARALKSRQDHPKRWILIRVKMNAKKRGILCTLTEQDIPDFPKLCPVFPWIELTYEVGEGRKPSSVSVDRIDSNRGYVPKNIRIISDRANMLKNNASDEELVALVKDAESRVKGNQ